MSQNPYASFNQGNMPIEPPKTSILAILSLVSSLICCIPGLGVLGALLGTVAVFRISGSGGRKSGTGIAITGIVVGIIVTVAWVFISMGIASVLQQLTGVSSRIINPLNNNAAAEFRPLVSTPLQGALTDARFAEFKTNIESEIGAIQLPPDSVLKFFTNFAEVEKQMNSVQQRPGDFFPVPIQGLNAWGVLILHMDQPADPNLSNFSELMLKATKNIEFIGPSGKSIWLVPPGADGVTPDPVLPGGGSSPDAPKTPEAPKTPPSPSTP